MALMDGQPKEPNHLPTMSRRDALVAGVIVFADGMVASVPKSALAAMEPSTQDSFMHMSTLLINHQLRPEIGVRVAETAAGQYKDLPGMLDAIIAIAERKHAAVVEDFFADIPDGELKDFAHWVILAWYSGCSSEKADATVFAYEEALTFKTTGDVVAIPSYCFSGPNRWSQTTAPLANMPKF
jgi:fructose 5-dehydrogenase small subunit